MLKIIIICEEAIKGKVVPVYAMKAHRGRRGTAALILNLCAYVNFTSQLLFHRGKNPRYPWNRSVSDSKSWPGCFWKRGKCLAHAIEPSSL
jgi:hypothetical protein